MIELIEKEAWLFGCVWLVSLVFIVYQLESLASRLVEINQTLQRIAASAAYLSEQLKKVREIN
jgi:type II secretory pathway component PulM